MHIACSGFSHDQRSMIITNDKSDMPAEIIPTKNNFWRNKAPVSASNAFINSINEYLRYHNAYKLLPCAFFFFSKELQMARARLFE